MKILFLAVEGSPYAKVGGLADVIGSLPKALTALGHDVRVLLPHYAMVNNPLREIANFRVDVNDWWIKRATLSQVLDDEATTYLLGTDEWFTEVDRSERVYTLGVDAYLFFSRAALRACEAIEWIPDIVHCHDWHTGLTAVLMREQHGDVFAESGSIFTIHNLAYQGEFPAETLDKVGLPKALFNLHQLEAYGSLNFIKSGAAYSDYTNTVSETYAREIQTEAYGCRLNGFLKDLAGKGQLSGIVNGIDWEEWNPATNLQLAANFDADHPQDKANCREALLAELKWEPIEGAPLAGVVSRLSSQKGMDLMLQVANQLFEAPMQLIVQGLGDPWLADEFRKLESKHPKHFRFAQRFDVDLAQRVYAGSDIFLMPSAFEPCGLGQMIAMRYGTIPVVRRTGGLADTVTDGENGYVFDDLNANDFLSTTLRAKRDFADRVKWSGMIDRAMRFDSSWRTSARTYEKLYMKSIAARRSRSAIAS